MNPGPTQIPNPAQRLAVRAGLSRSAPFTVGWHQAIFEHYRITNEETIRGFLPDQLVLDRHLDGSAYVSVVSFRMVGMAWRGLPLVGLRTYAQVNVRTYVHDGQRPGVFFLRNYVSNALATLAGRVLYGMPYRYMAIDPIIDLERGQFGYQIPLPAGDHRVMGTRGARILGHEDDPSSLLFFLAERYPLFSARRGRTCCAQMLHAPWQVFELEVMERSQSIPLDLGLDAALEPLDAVHLSPGVGVQMWGPRPIEAQPDWGGDPAPPRLEM